MDLLTGKSLKKILRKTLLRGPLLSTKPPERTDDDATNAGEPLTGAYRLPILNFDATGPRALDGVLPVFIAPVAGKAQERLSKLFDFELDADFNYGNDGIYDGGETTNITWRRFFSVDPELQEDYTDAWIKGGRTQEQLDELRPQPQEGLPLEFWTRESLRIYESLFGFRFDINNEENLDTDRSIVIFGTVETGFDTETRQEFLEEYKGSDIAAMTTVAIEHQPGVYWTNAYDVSANRYNFANQASQSGKLNYIYANSINTDPNIPDWQKLLNKWFKSTVHEQGHTLGLAHPGNYNGSLKDAEGYLWSGDSWDESTMSYSEQPAAFEYFGKGQGFSLLNLTPRTVDMLAIDRIYGKQQDSQGRSFGTHRAFRDDTTYFFNTEITEDQSIVYANLDKLFDYRVAVTIADGKGKDTIDVSGYGRESTIDLYIMTGNEKKSRLSSINGNIGNLSFAVGTRIENAYGGSANDKFYDNELDNQLKGNGGNDWFQLSHGKDRVDGGEDVDTVYIRGKRNNYSMIKRGDQRVVIRSKTHSGDRFILKNVEIITFETKKRLTERSGNKNSILALSNHKSDPITNPDAATAMAMAGNQGHRHTQEAVESGMLISGSNVMDLSLIGIENTPLTAARNQAGESALAGL